MIENSKFKKIFESYNLSIQKACEEGLMNVKTSQQYEKLINIAREKWEITKINNLLPFEYFNEIKDHKQLLVILKNAIEICDEYIPISFIKIILDLNAAALIEEFAFGNYDLETKTTALKIIGEIKKEDYVVNLISTIYNSDEELIKEVSRQALIDTGNVAIPYILKKLETKTTIVGDDFHLVLALIGIDKEKRSDLIYKSIKEYFLKAEDIALATRCLVDYNDPRAITFLRGYIIKNQSKVEKKILFEVIGAIEMLGGKTEDIVIS